MTDRLVKTGLGVLQDMDESQGSPRDLESPQIRVLRAAFEDREVGLYLFSTHIFGYKDLTTNIHLPISQFLGKWGMSEMDDGGEIWHPRTELDGDV